MDPSEIVGVVPAAGAASRLQPSRYPKELLPVSFARAEGGPGLRPVPAALLTLRAMRRAGVARALVVVSPQKLELCRVLGDGAEAGLALAYVVQEEPLGLAHAVRCAAPWVAGRRVCLGLPDTVFAPEDAHARACAALSAGADLVLGVFPTERPCELGPVRVDAGGRVLEVQEKPATPCAQNTWGLAAWSSAFGAFLEAQDPALPLGRTFDAAARAGLSVRAVSFPEGRYLDVGTPRGLADLLEAHAEPGARGQGPGGT